MHVDKAKNATDNKECFFFFSVLLMKRKSEIRYNNVAHLNIMSRTNQTC